jgi:hypothetical protein
MDVNGEGEPNVPFEIWIHRKSGEKFLVVVAGGIVNVAAGPLLPGQDPVEVLETHGNQSHNPKALLDMRKRPSDYEWEYAADKYGKVRRLV